MELSSEINRISRVSNHGHEENRGQPFFVRRFHQHIHGSGYDTIGVRLFEFIPTCGFLVFLRYAMRRVDSPVYGIVVERGIVSGVDIPFRGAHTVDG